MNRVKEAIEALKNNEIILVTDDEDRENEGDMICAGENITGEMINIMATYAKGLICTPIGKDVARKLALRPMVKENTDNHETAFTVSIDHIDTSTGISAFERADTIRALANENTKPSDFRRPGHVFPLIAKDGGVLERDGHTEATIDLMRLAGLKEVGVCCEIMADDGHMMRGEDLIKLAEKLNMKITTVKEIQEYRKNLEVDVLSTNPVNLPSEYGNFKAYGFLDRKTGKEHIALTKGDIKKEGVLTRIHSECLTGDVLGSRRCDCGSQLHKALQNIEKNGEGVLLYLRQEGRGIGLFNKLKAYELQENGYDTVDANLELGFPEDMRDYKIASEMLERLGVKSVNLMTNNPDKINQLEKYGINVAKRCPIEIKSNDTDRKYLEIKATRMGHELEEFKERKNA
ncbi:GTP cyclohydrolase II [uncultured Anaerococcus sp.]|uniref:GTP cyclohydrolase II n=1 Tax=uncultured Anaerococcus sp. TaxID=293428 RepID=UPI00280B958B|nr:GTP cyclohydrolase II [uncultured Anaerococcus sp.]MDU5149305.1 GTP cyclohydrolase II [Anaerococcus prevotii]